MNVDQVADVLARTQLFGQLDRPTLLRVAQRSRQRTFDKGDSLFVQDELGDRLFVLTRGVVKLFIRSRDGKAIELVRHRPPAIFGELAVLDGGRRSASAVAVEPAVCGMIGRDDLLALLREDGRLLDGLLKSLGWLVRRANQQTTDQVFLDLPGRLARKLLELDMAGWGGRVTQADLAQMVGGSRQTVNDTLRAFRERGLVEQLASGEIKILDPDGLRRRAGGEDISAPATWAGRWGEQDEEHEGHQNEHDQSG